MKEQIKNRLNSLQQEYQKGQTELQRLEKEISTIQSTMLRISGAIQVLKEELEINEQEDNALPSDAIIQNGKKEISKQET